MIGLMERTCVELTEPYLDRDEQTVGIHVDVRHLAATNIGQEVTITAELLEIKNSDHIRIMASAGNVKDLVYDSIVKFVRANTR